MKEIPLQIALDFTNQLVHEKTGKYLTDLQINIFKESLIGLTYKEMAVKYGYTMEYLNNDVGYSLWKVLSLAFEEEVGKKNLHGAIRREIEKINDKPVTEEESNLVPSLLKKEINSLSLESFPFPEGSEPLNSSFYVEREDIENLCRHTVLMPGCLLRIKAPRLMGKTSLISRLVNHVSTSNYRVVRLEFDSIDRQILKNVDQLLRWICSTSCRQLKLEDHISESWNSKLGNNDNCTFYFEDYIIPAIDTPLVLVLDDVDRVFPYTEVIEDFFGLLRSWHEKGKTSDLWRQVRLVIAHSTEAYIPLDLNQSPFNAGVPVELKDFKSQQILNLAALHQLNWQSDQVMQLMNKIGGHPYLVRLALYEIGSGKISLEQFLKEESAEAEIYSTLLRRYLETLKSDPELARAYKKVVTAMNPIALDTTHVFHLHSLGLVHYQNNNVFPACDLYRQYFSRVL
jgi:AAA-like domain